MSERTDRVASLIVALAATFIRNEANPSPLITVTRADISPDLTRTTVFVSVFPEDREDDALIFLARKAGDFRSFLKSEASLKRLPHCTFAIDYGEKHRQKLDALAQNIEEPESTG